MRATARAMLALSLTAAMLAAAPAPAAEGLKLKRVMLSAGGVGYFEYEARVAGAADLTLEVRRDRIDDLLKSIVVYDDQGGIGSISLPGREPLQDAFRELPFGPEALESPVALLNAVRGAEVRLAGNPELAGRLVAVTEDQEPAGPGAETTVPRHRISLLTADGLRQAILEDAGALQLADPRLRAQVEAALAAMAQHSERDRRRLTIHTTAGPAGTGSVAGGERTVRVAYVVAAPLWKTAYRLTLEAARADRGLLQGWAVLENQSGEDWSGVELTLASGNPVTFRQALYDTYYVDRPQVPVEVLGRVLPRLDQGATPIGGEKLAVAAPPGEARRSGTRGLAISELAPPPAPMAMARPMEAPPPRLADVAAAEASEAATQVVFRHPEPVSVTSGHSLLLPIVSRAVPAERLALYQPATQPRHPLAAVRLSNDSGSSLPPGILTLYERSAEGAVSYVGDARLAAFPVGEERLLAFAVDQKVTIDRSDEQSETLTSGRITDGLLSLSVADRLSTRYTLTGASREARTVLIEHPRRAGWELVEPAAAGQTADAFRLRQELAPGQTASLTVVQRRPRLDQYELTALSAEQIRFYAAARELSEPQRKAIARLAELNAAVAEPERQAGRLEAEQKQQLKDQERLRENLRSVAQGTDLHRRYLAKLGQTEDQLERLAGELAQVRKAQEAARQAVAEYVRGVKL
jgi:hypothetical protein